MTRADWIAVDWGTTRLRAWAMRGADPVAKAESDEGMSALAGAGFEAALIRLIEGWLTPGRRTPVIAAGMVGARGGWVEAPYRPAPCAAAADELIAVETADDRIAMRIAPGVSQSDPPDVMRGEETQIAGLLAVDPDFDGVVCLPGTHTKWVRVSAREVVGFRTFMTGELFALIADRSVLRLTMGTGWDDAAFAAAVADGMARPEALASRLFGLRAGALLDGLSGDAARARASGLLIGMELAAARGWWLGARVALIGSGATVGAYQAALATQSAPAELHDAGSMSLAGLAAISEGRP